MQDRARIDGLGEIIVAAAPEVEVRNGADRCDDILSRALKCPGENHSAPITSVPTMVTMPAGASRRIRRS